MDRYIIYHAYYHGYLLIIPPYSLVGLRTLLGLTPLVTDQLYTSLCSFHSRAHRRRAEFNKQAHATLKIAFRSDSRAFEGYGRGELV